MDETIRAKIKLDCDRILEKSEYSLTFEPVDDDFEFPHVTYFDMEGNAIRINYTSKGITYIPVDVFEREGIISSRKVPLQDIRDLLYALEGSALSIYAEEYENSGAKLDGVPSTHLTMVNTTLEGNNLLELFTNLLARHQDESTKEYFQSELKRLNGDVS